MLFIVKIAVYFLIPLIGKEGLREIFATDGGLNPLQSPFRRGRLGTNSFTADSAPPGYG